MDMEATQQLPSDDGLDREAAMTRQKTLVPIHEDIIAEEPADSEIVARHETDGALHNVDTDIETTIRDQSDTFSSKDSSSLLKYSAITLAVLYVSVFGYLGFLLIQ